MTDTERETAPKRKPLPKRMRFEVFKRDGFACQYCGATPPGVLLHVDHIVPVAEGGGNEVDNLVTACEPCNLGKGAVSLGVVPKSLREKALEVAEREEQIHGYQKILQAKRDRLEDDAWAVVEVLFGAGASIRRDWFLSVKRFIDMLGRDATIQCAEIAISRKSSRYETELFRYFCGVCWKTIKGES